MKIPKRFLNTIPNVSLSQAEIDSIKQSPFLSSIKLPKEPALSKVEIISKSIPLKDGLLIYKRPSNVPVPFAFLKMNQPESPNRTPLSAFPRLSVTQLLTENWCELRDFYEIYSKQARVESPAMVRGHQIHSKLEDTTHRPINDSKYKQVIPTPDRTAYDDLVYEEIKKVYKLYWLLTTGRCRELYLHGFINQDSGVFVDPNASLIDSDLTITGVIDYLFLRSKDPTHPLQQEMMQFANDIGLLINNSPQIIDKYKHLYKLTVCDVKTRSRRSLPPQKSVIDGSKLQVMMYERLLRNFNENSYDYTLEYYKRKGVDVDGPLTPEYAVIWSMLHPYLFQDFIRISDGQHIGFEPFDNYHYSDESYDLSYLLDTVTDEGLISQLKPLLKPWKRPLTLRYFIAQSSRLMNNISKLLDGDLRIQYYYKTEMFEEIKFKYQETETNKLAKHSMDFWFGFKDPVPIERTFKNINEKCRYCDFKHHCLWKNEAVASE